MAYLLAIAFALLAPAVAQASETVSYNDKLKEALPGFEMPAAWLRSHTLRFGSLVMCTALAAST